MPARLTEEHLPAWCLSLYADEFSPTGSNDVNAAMIYRLPVGWRSRRNLKWLERADGLMSSA